MKNGVTVEQKYPFLLASVLEGEGSVNGTAVKKRDVAALLGLQNGKAALDGMHRAGRNLNKISLLYGNLPD